MQILKSRRNLGIVLISLLAAGSIAGILIAASLTGKLPQIDIDDIFQPNNPPANSDKIDGYIGYDIFLDYANGDRETYGKNILVPELDLASLIRPFSISDSSQSRELKTITIRAQGELDLPSDTSRIGPAVTTASTVEVFLGSQKIDMQTFTEQMTLQEIQSGEELYEVVLPVASLTLPAQSGEYALSFKSTDKITFTIDGQPRSIDMQTTPTVFMEGLQPLYVQANSASVGYVYTRTPNVDPTFGDVISYNHYLDITARNFKPNSEAFFDYTFDHGSTNTYFRSRSDTADDKTRPTDAIGTATDRLTVSLGSFSTKECDDYHAWVDVSDGMRQIRAELGCD